MDTIGNHVSQHDSAAPIAPGPCADGSAVKAGEQTPPRREPIPGYVLRDKLGTGGYGEVWLADAPGGLRKAVKIVFGHANSVQAERELRAMQHIRQVSHPFLLSLERVEVVDNQLVIVTELADGSVKDRFNKYIESDLPGIPREELLGWLRDAADALDYLFDKHGLQHLDIKPENLLIVGGHVKVADFGMVKEISARDNSLVSGLTPLYAGPELFDGRPSRFSDQYSLAIVYQEMLTGSPPFVGRTAAQLASQHLNAKPDLRSLSISDQSVVARALAKDPERRFPSCRAMVDALIHAPHAATSALRRPANSADLGLGNSDTKEAATRLSRAANTSVLSGRSRAISELPPLDAVDTSTAFRPTVYIGLGSLGRRVLERVRARFATQLSNSNIPAAYRFIVMDTDRSDLKSCDDSFQTIFLPLKTTANYRERSDSLLEWLSRRWLYNIPRSLKTEGIRPLGRLAWIDHYEQTFEALRQSLSIVTDTESLEASNAIYNTKFDGDHPRVMIVGSLNGGTSSGIAPDMIYTARSVLRDLRLGEDNVCAFLLHCLPRKAASRDLGIANACATLSEMNHYLDAESGYPGEPACGLPAFRGESAATPGVYVIQGAAEESSTDDGTERTLKQLGDYLFLNSATNAAAYFDTCRAASSKPHDEGVVVRSLGFWRNCDDTDFVPLAVEFLQRLLMEQWVSGREGSENYWSQVSAGQVESSTPVAFDERLAPVAVRQGWEQLLAQREVRIESIVMRAQAHMEQSLGCSPQKYFTELVAQQCHGKNGASQNSVDGVSMFDLIDQLTMGGGIGNATSHVDPLLGVADRHLDSWSLQISDELRSQIAEWVNNPAIRLRYAGAAAMWLRKRLSQMTEKLDAIVERLNGDAATRRSAATSLPGEAPKYLEYAAFRFHEASHRASLKALGQLVEQLDACICHLSGLGTRLLNLPDKAVPQRSLNEGESTPRWRARDLASATSLLSRNQSHVLAEMNSRFTTILEGLKSSLFDLLGMGPEEHQQLGALLRKTAETVVAETLQEPDRDSDPNELIASLFDPKTLRELAEKSKPALEVCGGGKRLLVIAPRELAPFAERITAAVHKTLGSEPTVVFEKCRELTLCYEVEQVPLENVAATISSNRRQYHELAERLQTRIDVKWKPFLAWNTKA